MKEAEAAKIGNTETYNSRFGNKLTAESPTKAMSGPMPVSGQSGTAGSPALNDDTVDHGAGFVYFGIGPSVEAAETEAGGAPWSPGFITPRFGSSDITSGLDFSREGTRLDSTRGSEKLTKADSYNALPGVRLKFNPAWRANVAFLPGVREVLTDCPDSYLGYRCYADDDPDVETVFNSGISVMSGWESFAIGIRATDVSTQALLGTIF